MQDSSNSLPPVFRERLSTIVPSHHLPQVLEAFTTQRIPSLRVNTLKETPEKVVKKLQDLGFGLQPVSWNTAAYLLTKGESRFLTETTLYKDGKIYIQNLSSMIPSLVLDPQKNDKVLDIAAAPGSKTTQIAALMGNTGEIVANDISRERLFRLRSNIDQQGVSNVKILQLPGEVVWKKFPEYFDRALVDVPCTMEGRFCTLDPDTYTSWAPKKSKLLSQKQKYLLRSAVSATRPGGVIVYATCTLSPTENEEVINWLLKIEKDAVEIEKIDIPDVEITAGFTEFGNKKFHPSLAKTVRVLPSKEMEGFFIARIRKISSNLKIDQIG